MSSPVWKNAPKVDITPLIGYSPPHIGHQSDAQTLSARLFGFSKARRRKIGGDISEFLAADSRKQIPITREAALELGFQLDGSGGVLPLRLADPPVREHRVVVGAAPAHLRKVAARVRIHEVPQGLSPQDI